MLGVLFSIATTLLGLYLILTCLYKQSEFSERKNFYLENVVLMEDGSYLPQYKYSPNSDYIFSDIKTYRSEDDIPKYVILYYDIVFKQYMKYGNNSGMLIISTILTLCSVFVFSILTVLLGWYHDDGLE